MRHEGKVVKTFSKITKVIEDDAQNFRFVKLTRFTFIISVPFRLSTSHFDDEKDPGNAEV